MDIKVIVMTVKTLFSHDSVAEDTNAAEGNLAEIRKARMAEAKSESINS